jgi:glucose 1-dehydrogenase
MNGIAGKNVLVTGASSGIGQAIAVRFAEEGANVGINFNRHEAGAAATQQRIESVNSAVRSTIVQADVADTAQVAAMFEQVLGELGGLDILINNAGFQVQGDTHVSPEDDFSNVIEANLIGAYRCARRMLQHLMASKKAGVLINVSSVHEIIPKPGFLGYSVSKGGMRNLTRTLALEYAPHGIRVNGVGPGATVTPMNSGWIDDAKKRAVVESHIPMGRAGTAAEMAAVTAFLCSDDASYITGQTLFVDGGLTLFPEFGTPWSSE